MLVWLMFSIGSAMVGCGLRYVLRGRRFAWVLTLGCLVMTFFFWHHYLTQSPGSHGAFLRVLMAIFLTMGSLGIEIADRIG